MRASVVIAVLALWLAACKTEVNTVYVDVPTLAKSDLYRIDTVLTFLEAYGEKNASIAKYYFDRAQDEKDNNVEMAIYSLKRSISLQPSLAAYRKLAELLLKNKQYNELTELDALLVSRTYKDQRYLFNAPQVEEWTNYFKSQILAYGYISNDYIYEAREFGLDMPMIRKRVLSDADLALDTASLQYKTLWLQMDESENLKELATLPSMRTAFYQSAEDSSKEFSIDEKSVATFKYAQGEGDYFVSDLSMVFQYMLPEAENKEYLGLDFNIKHAYSPSEGLKVVVCALDTSELACPRDMRQVYHRLMVFNNEHKLVDHRIIAKQCGEELSMATVNGIDIYVSNFKRTWEKPYDSKNFDNTIKSLVEVGSDHFVIAADGKIVQVSERAGSL